MVPVHEPRLRFAAAEHVTRRSGDAAPKMEADEAVSFQE